MSRDDRPNADFGIAASIVGKLTLLALRGQVDCATAPDFRAFFNAMIDIGHHSVVLDLAELDFMDVSGLSVIADGANRLRSSGGTLTIRTPSSMVTSLLEIPEITKLVLLEEPTTVLTHVVSAPAELPQGLARRDPHRAVPYLRVVSAIPSGDEVVNGALRLVVALATATVRGADGVSVSLRRRGRLATVAASDQTVTDMHANQYAAGEGPCIDASVQGHMFYAKSLNTESRWPAFTPRAQTLGINAILSTPPLTRNESVGALNIYSNSPGAFAPKDQELATVFATEASIIWTDGGLDVTEGELSERLSGVLRSREPISQAQGLIMERHGVRADEAYTQLRRGSLKSGRPLHERAGDVVTSSWRSEIETSSGLGGNEHD